MPLHLCPLSKKPPRVPVMTKGRIVYDFIAIAQKILSISVDDRAADLKAYLKIDILTYDRSTKELNDAQMKEVTPLSFKEKIEVALYCNRLIDSNPSFKILGIERLEDMKALIGESLSERRSKPESFIITERFMKAVEEGHLYMVRKYLTIVSDITLFNNGFVTPLTLAASKGHIAIVIALLAKGAAVNEVAANGLTPLYAAVRIGYLPLVNVLLEVGGDFKTSMSDGRTLLFVAVEHGHLEIVQTLLARGADANAVVINSATALFYAANNGRLDIVNALLAKGANPRHKMSIGKTALYFAAKQGHVEIVQTLMAAGADMDLVAMDNPINPLMEAVLFNRFEVVKAICDHLCCAGFILFKQFPTGDGYEALLKRFLSVQYMRDYYLKDMIIQPESMREAFKANPIFYKELLSYRSSLWLSLSGSHRFNMAPEAHKSLLVAILNPAVGPGVSYSHPLRDLFSAPIPSHSSFFKADEQNLLLDIKAYVDATYTQPILYSAGAGQQMMTQGPG